MLPLQEKNECPQQLNTDPDGLSQLEAEKRLALYGPNSIGHVSQRSLLKEFLGNYTHLMALLLWVGGGIAFFAQMPQLGIAIWLVNLINGSFSFWQEYRAEKATEALLGLLPTSAHVIRDGQEMRISAEQLVPGDIIFLAEGDHVSADARIISAFALSTDESTLTGESRPVRKAASPEQGEEDSHQTDTAHVFAGTSVLSGTCKAVVSATGMRTRFGKIAHLTQSIVDDTSPLQKEMSRVTKVVTVLATSIGALFFLLAVFIARISPAEGFVFAMGMIVAFVPEGMLPTVSLALALAVQRMAQRNALVKRLSAVETLGCTSVICTDKTGTITQNQMTVENIWLWGAEYRVSGSGYCPEGEIIPAAGTGEDPDTSSLTRLLIAGLRCNNARLIPPHIDAPGWAVLGDPTEGALLVAARKGLSEKEASEQWHRICEFPFDSYRKRMSTIYDVGGTRTLYLKGAPAEVVSRCARISTADGECLADEAVRDRIMESSNSYASAGLRVLAVASRKIPIESNLTPENLEHDLTFLGLVAMKDPPHPGVSAAVEKCHQAGIKIVMITGDDGLTAKSIARNVGIADDSCTVISGSQLDTMDDPALHKCLDGNVIFARVAPEHKLRIVNAFQQLGHIVAVTGDGVNDAPALRKSDIGIAMGIAGSDVAKESADIILTDDNFASIVSAIELGRAVYANIRKFAIYVFNSNMAEAVPFIVTLFSRGAIPLPLTVMQVLCIDLGTDMVPALGLGAEAAEAGVMSCAPRNLKEPLLNLPLLCRALLWYGMIEAAAGMSCYFFVNWLHGWPSVGLASPGSPEYRMATTMTVMGIVATQVGAVLCCRTDRASVFSVGLFSNRLVLIGIAVEILLLLALMHIPFLETLFNTAPVGLAEWSFALAWTPLVLLLDELRKLIIRWTKGPLSNR